MSESPNSQQPPKSKGLKLEDLLPNKATVETSIGPLYVRHAYRSDWKRFTAGDAHTLGMAAVRQLCNRIESKKDSSPLEEQDLQALTESDIETLVPTIAKRSGWGPLATGAGFIDLGNAMKEAAAKAQASHIEMLEGMRKSLDTSYSFLGKTELEKLQQQMAALADLRGVLPDLGTTDAASRASAALAGTLMGTATQKSALEMANDLIDAGMPKIAFPTSRSIESTAIYTPPRFEDTPLGRATLESTENTREVSQKMDALVNVVAGLNQTVIRDVLPAWVKQVEADQKGAKDAFDQAANGLKWTKVAVWASVLVTALATWWQVHVAQEMDRQNGEQQKRVEELMQVQLKVLKQLLDQQARDAKALNEQQMRDAAALRKALEAYSPGKQPEADEKGRQ